MRPSKILRVARSDEKDESAVILHVQPTAATIPLNVSITATDGSEGYGLTLKDSKTKALKDSSSEQSDEDWKAVLRVVLLADAPPEELHLLNNIQLSALVKKDAIVVSVREDVGGIRRRLGILHFTPQDVEIELWDWLDRVCKEKDEAVVRSAKAEKEAAEARAKLDKLERQIQDLSSAKRKHEDALILQFQRLLNEKKKKIRELSRGQRSVAAPAADVSDEDEGEEEEPEGSKPKPKPRLAESKLTNKDKKGKAVISKTISGRKRKQEEEEEEEEEEKRKPLSEDDGDDNDDTGDEMVVDRDSLEEDSLKYRGGSIKFDPDAEDRQTTDDETLGGTTDDDDEEL
ncbi:ribose-5-phosphate isomerase rki1 [Orbilia blumenaviensis]|uniref:Ribose-5-phosphate isomerase rki1 n=1 Tax=Orbilia blumenaviensis TaxID=1796055 RepID=A0AAV9VMJ4_9PEZI